MIKRRMAWCVLLGCLVIPLATGCAPTEETVTVTTMGEGGSDYLVVTAMAPGIEESTGIKIRMHPTDLRLSQVAAIRSGEAEIMHMHLGSGYRYIVGLEEAAAKDWGPQRLQMVFQGYPAYCTVITRADSGIETIEDIKGHSFATYPGGAMFMEACLAYAGLTPDDVTVIQSGGYAAAIDQVHQGRADVAYNCAGGGNEQEIAASPHGIRFIETPFACDACWERLRGIAPQISPMSIPEGVGVEEAWGREVGAYKRTWYAYESLDPDIAYVVTKGCVEGYEIYKSNMAGLQFQTLENCMHCLDVPVPFHEGAVKYFKEIGVWTAEHEAWQEAQLKLQDGLAAAWEEANSEAQSKGIEVSRENQAWLDLWYARVNSIMGDWIAAFV